MLYHERTTSENEDFRNLVQDLDVELSVRNGDKNSFYAQFNKIDLIKNVILAYYDGKAIGCGAFKEYSQDQVEIKRMYVSSQFRGTGIATGILKQLEEWASELNYNKCILETGLMQSEAIQLYEKNGYGKIPNYGQYNGVETSVCFEKILTDQ